MKNFLLYSAIGAINGTIFGIFIVILIHYSLIFIQADNMLKTLLKPLEMFKDIINLANVNKRLLKEETKKLLDSKLNDPATINALKQEEKDYNNEFNIFMSIIGVTGFLAVCLLSFIIIKNAKFKFRMGQFVDFDIITPKHIFAEWFGEIFVTVCLLAFIYVYFAHISSEYVYANVMDVFVDTG